MSGDRLNDEAELRAELRAYNIPNHIHDGLVMWILHGYRPGHFLTAVLTNDLREAVARADNQCGPALPSIVGFLYNHAPMPSWGSLANFKAWHEEHAAARAAANGETS